MSALLPQPGGFEGLAAEAKCAEGTSQGQVILPPEEAPLPQPCAVVKVTVQLHAALAPFGANGRVDKDSIIADGDHLFDR